MENATDKSDTLLAKVQGGLLQDRLALFKARPRAPMNRADRRAAAKRHKKGKGAR